MYYIFSLDVVLFLRGLKLMKKVMLLMPFLLTGCPGPGDRFTPGAATTVILKGSSVCALSIMKSGEKLTAVEIYSSKDEPVFIQFNDKPPLCSPRSLFTAIWCHL